MSFYVPPNIANQLTPDALREIAMLEQESPHLFRLLLAMKTHNLEQCGIEPNTVELYRRQGAQGAIGELLELVPGCRRILASNR